MFGYWFLSFAAVLLWSEGTYALSSEEESKIKEAFHPFVMQCAEDFGITEDQFEEAKKKGSSEGIDPCFISCFLKKSEFFDSEGMFKPETANSFAESYLTSEKAIKFMKAVGEECAKVNEKEVSDGAEGCERAMMMFECVQEVQKKED